MNASLEPRRLVNLEEGGTSLEMEVYMEVELEGRVFALLVPADLSVDLVQVNSVEDGEILQPVDSGTLVSLKSEIREALKAWNVEFHFEDGEAFLRGDPDEEFYADCETVEVDTEDGDSEEFIVLLELATGESTYLLLTALTPELIAAELVDEGRARSLSDDELQELEDIFRQALSMDEDA